MNWLDSDQQVSWRNFLTGQALVMDAINQDMVRDSELTLNEYEVLVRLSESPGKQLRMSSLAQNLVHSRSRLTHTVKRLENAGFVHREHCAEDGRGILCKLTAAGLNKLTAAAPPHVDSVRSHLVDRLSDEEFAALGKIFGKLVNELGR